MVLAAATPQGTRRLLDDLEGIASEHYVKRLELAHKRQRFEREQAAELAELDSEIEHAAYFALMAGVPEEDIYGLDDERLSSALERAMRLVQAQA